MYESLVALNPNLEKDAVASLLEGFKEIISRHGGTILTEKDLGKKKFAYTVKKFSTGFYLLLYYSVKPEAVFDLERSFKHSEDVLKFITIRVEDEAHMNHSLSVLEAPPMPPGAGDTPTPSAPEAPPAPAKEETPDGQLQ
jgi:small subunit ribosomal protein S6